MSEKPKRRKRPRKPSDLDQHIKMILAKGDRRAAFAAYQAEVGLDARDVLAGFQDAMSMAASVKELLAVWKQIALLTGIQPKLGPCSRLIAPKQQRYQATGRAQRPAWKPPEPPKNPWRSLAEAASSAFLEGELGGA